MCFLYGKKKKKIRKKREKVNICFCVAVNVCCGNKTWMQSKKHCRRSAPGLAELHPGLWNSSMTCAVRDAHQSKGFQNWILKKQHPELKPIRFCVEEKAEGNSFF